MDLKIDIPKKARVLVEEGEEVKFNQPIFEILAQKEIKIDISRQLKIPPQKIFNYLKKFIDDEVKKDELLAEKKGVFGTKKVLSPQNGVIKEINHEEGTIILNIFIDKKTVKSYFKGKIKAIDKNEVIVQLPSAKAYPIKTASTNFGGPTFYLSPSQPIDAETIEQKVVVFSSISPLNQIKIETLGAAGMVTIEPLPNQPEIPFCYLKNLPDFEQILKSKFSACTISKDESKIIFYD